MYRQDENEPESRQKDFIQRKIVYINNNNEKSELIFSESESVILKDMMQRYKLSYNLFNIKNENNLEVNSMIELAQDNRKCKLRVNCQFNQGLTLELYEVESDEVITKL